MMYSQQEYDMVRRQTMQIEAEKRTVIRWALIAVTALLAASLILTGWMYRHYSTSDNKIVTAETQARDAETKLGQVSRELAEKNALLEQYSGARAKYNEVIESTVPRMLSRAAPEAELAALAQAIYQQPGHMIELPSIPPNDVLRSYRIRVEGRPFKYTLVPGLLDGKWVIYSVLVKNQED
jgi:hypothetical protein